MRFLRKLMQCHRKKRAMMKFSFEQTLVEVWRQALVENAKTVALGADRFPVRRTPKKGLRQVDLVFKGNEIRGWSRIRRRNPAGHNWHDPARK